MKNPDKLWKILKIENRYIETSYLFQYQFSIFISRDIKNHFLKNLDDRYTIGFIQNDLIKMFLESLR